MELGALLLEPVGFAALDVGAALFGTVRLGTVRLGTVRLGTVRLGTVRFGTVRFGTTCLGGRIGDVEQDHRVGSEAGGRDLAEHLDRVDAEPADDPLVDE